jgi:hypothetical protein
MRGDASVAVARIVHPAIAQEVPILRLSCRQEASVLEVAGSSTPWYRPASKACDSQPNRREPPEVGFKLTQPSKAAVAPNTSLRED